VAVSIVEKGNKVEIEYTVTLADGSEVDTNVGSAPLSFTQGEQEILPAIEAAVLGLNVGDSTTLTLEPHQAYGEHQEDAFQEVQSSLIPEEARHAGAVLVAEDDSGNRRQVRVHEVKAEAVVLDLNHPLAGQRLTFDIRVVAIR
jgi:FKBP-type peptidyl-prolyl cis-trans isomerase 2